MKSIPFSGSTLSPDVLSEISEVLSNGELVCIPTPSGYKIVADFHSPPAIMSMLMAKRRVQNAPALVLLPAAEWIDRIAADITDDARTLMSRFWPGPVTLLFKPSEDLDSKLSRSLTKATGWLGVRMPEDDVSRTLLEAFGRPLAVSSANLAKKGGAGSPAQVRKNFGRTVQLILDKGDINTSGASTLVDVSAGRPRVIREGSVPSADIHAALAPAGAPAESV